MNKQIGKQQFEEFKRNGFLILRNFYDPESEILPVQRDIYNVIGLLIGKYKLDIKRPAFSPENFDAGYQQLIATNRAYGGEVYDAVKQIPAFMRLVAHSAHDALFTTLRPGSMPAIAAGGYGIRIDNPGEDRFRANWHQEYPAQLRSLDGIVLWSPLVSITQEIGPIVVGIGSHKDGLVPVHVQDSTNSEKRGAYGLSLQNEEERLGRYAQVAPLTNPSDLIVMDFLLLHASGQNVSKRSRWSMQTRYFNFNDATGLSHSWQGSYAAGVDFRSIHPELCANKVIT